LEGKRREMRRLDGVFGKCEGKRLLERLGLIWKDNIKADLEEID
jgi:hypothetical protein